MMSEDRPRPFPRSSDSALTDSTTGDRWKSSWRSSLCLMMLAVSSTGCTMFENISQNFRYSAAFNDAAMKMRHRSMSSKNWHLHKNRFCNEPCLDDFCSGYRQGFEDVAGGGTGCTPNFPPRDYWGWQHQSADGQRKVSAWFAGYPHGARAAEEQGMGSWSQIQMSSGLQSQYVTAGVLPNQGHAVYPITEPVKSPLGAPTPVANPVNNVQAVPMPTQSFGGYPQMPVPVTVNGSGTMNSSVQ